ncbi:hypothetical protein CJ030_MR1G008999 [Morella rubra]|uniref:VQ domain-containing protein n=1 Tax=Morella rubra TaxID=262757 RepID=A0A6A1WNI6_9ROSI|nr:hypothetical protein CJ030_MR1G008999 [Morella rubra]
MGEMVEPHSWKPSSASSELSMHRSSRVISKFKGKIRIVHIYAPEVIKTDAANFRELVQRLTGKPAEKKGKRNISKSPATSNELRMYRRPSMNMEMRHDLANLQNGVRTKEGEEEIWRNDILSGFSDGFSDLDGFIEELSELPVF